MGARRKGRTISFQLINQAIDSNQNSERDTCWRRALSGVQWHREKQ